MFCDERYFVRRRVLEGKITDSLCQVISNVEPIDIDAGAVLDAIVAQHGIFVEMPRNIFSFAHFSFQEYFTAKHIVDNGDERLVISLGAHIADIRWREVILLVLNMLNTADILYDYSISFLDGLVKDDQQITSILGWANKLAILALAPSDALMRYYDLLEKSIDMILSVKRAFERAENRWRILRRYDDQSRRPTLGVENMIHRVVEIATILDLHDLVHNFNRLKVPGQFDSADAWKDFRDSLRQAFISVEILGVNWWLTGSQIATLRRYIYGHQLLNQGLSLANLSSRSKYEKKLLATA